jgi:hypothetical protein
VNAALCLQLTVDPVLYWMKGLGVSSDDRARVMLLAIAGQESGLRYRAQVGGPARGLWQFERGGGVRGVLNHPATAKVAARACAELLIPATEVSVHPALEDNDDLACVFARLLLLSDPAPLPAMDQPDTGWGYYERNWRPGKPHRQTWAEKWRDALEAAASSNHLVRGG